MSKKIAFVLYLNQSSSNLDLCLTQLSKLDNNAVDVIIYLDSDIVSLSNTVENIFNTKECKNFTLIKNKSSLGQAFCYNDAIDSVDAKYIMFMNFNSVINDGFLDVTSEFLDGKYDVVSLESTSPNVFYNLNSSEYTEINKELILGTTNKDIYDKLFNLEYLKNNEINFVDNKWYPDFFNLQILLTFKMWKNIMDQPLITFWKNIDFDFNLYDLLFQIKKMDSLAQSWAVDEDFSMEFEYWYVYIAKYKFMSRVDGKYPLTSVNSKIVAIKNKEINKLADKNVEKNIKMFCPNLNKNPYYKTFRKLLETYDRQFK